MVLIKRKDLMTEEITQNYNKYKFLIFGIFGVYSFIYIKHNYTQPEFIIREKPNILIPRSVYEVRRKHYIYWELSRIARGYRKTFSYYNYDKESVCNIITFRNYYILWTGKEITT
jgi:hypothetical protein